MTEPKAVITHRMTFEGQTFNVTVREGAYEEMIRDTLNHFIVASRALRNSQFEQPKEQWCHRTEYNTNFAHDDAQVCVFGDVDVLFRERMVRVSINKCLETTSAWDIICLATELCKATWIDAPEDTRQQSAQEWADSPTPERQAPSVQSVSDSGTLNLGRYDSRMDYTTYDGQLVGFEVAKIAPQFTPNGQKFYAVYPYFGDGLVGKFPVNGMRIYEDNQYTPATVKEFVGKLGQDGLTANLRVVVRVKVKEGKCQYYTQKIEAK